MADSTSIILNYRHSDNKMQKSVTNVNPGATPADIYKFSTALMALTTDTLDGVTRVDKTAVDPATNPYILSGDEVINMVYDRNVETTSVANYVLLMYSAAEQDYSPIRNRAELTWTATPVGTIDTDKVSIEAEQEYWFAYVIARAKVSEDYTCQYDITATHNGNAITKRVTINFFANPDVTE